MPNPIYLLREREREEGGGKEVERKAEKETEYKEIYEIH